MLLEVSQESMLYGLTRLRILMTDLRLAFASPLGDWRLSWTVHRSDSAAKEKTTSVFLPCLEILDRASRKSERDGYRPVGFTEKDRSTRLLDEGADWDSKTLGGNVCVVVLKSGTSDPRPSSRLAIAFEMANW